jgi:hypothetical protein
MFHRYLSSFGFVVLVASAPLLAENPAEKRRPVGPQAPGAPLAPVGDEAISDGSFEAGSPNPSWTEFSLNFGTPLCTVGACGDGAGTGPRTGDWWTWFGGTQSAEEGSMSQDVVIGECATELRFWLEIPVCPDPAAPGGGPNNFMEVTVDGTQVFFVDDNSPLCDLVGYVEQVVDVSAFADGGSHTVEFHSVTPAQQLTNYFVDDVSLLSPATCGGPGAPAIPTMDRTGLVALALLLAAGAAFALRRRRRA